MAQNSGRPRLRCGARSGYYLDADCIQIEQLAKADYVLARMLRKLDCSILLVIDDVGFVLTDESESSALLELFIHRYEYIDP